MNTTDLVNKISVTHNITSGRAEMIVNIIIEKLRDILANEGKAEINNFGTFKIEQKSAISPYIMNQPMSSQKNNISFEADKSFLDKVNSF